MPEGETAFSDGLALGCGMGVCAGVLLTGVLLRLLEHAF